VLKNKTWEKLKKIKSDKKKAKVRVERTERRRRMKDKARVDKIGWTKSKWTF
jgi:hypothetical protein